MIPYLDLPVPKLGPIEIHAFGVLVAIGILVGAGRVRFRGRQIGLTDEESASLSTWAVVGGFVGAHLIDVLAYQTTALMQRPWLLFDSGAGVSMFGWIGMFFRQTRIGLLLNPAAGLSSFGGFLGAFLSVLIWTRRTGHTMLASTDSLAFGLATGWFFGRLGCYTAHDHPGRLTDFFLAVAYPGGARHDLGFDEALLAGALMLLFALLARRRRPVGLYIGLGCMIYRPVRFALDFLRVTDQPGADPRYGGLTPAQYGAIVVMLVGVAITLRVGARAARPDAEAATPPRAPTPRSAPATSPPASSTE